MNLQVAVVFAIVALVSGAPHGTALRRLESLLQEIAEDKRNTHVARGEYNHDVTRSEKLLVDNDILQI